MSFRALSAYGGLPEEPALPVLPPTHAFQMEWQWLHPLRAILAYCGWTIDDVVSSPRAASEVRTFWKIHKLSQRITLENARESESRGHRRSRSVPPKPVI